MKIVKVEDLHCDAGWRVNSFLKVTTDDGVVGWAEYMEGYGAQGLTGVIQKLAERFLIGRDPRPVEAISALLYAATRQAPGGINQMAIAAIENALVDVKAKALGVPVYELLGGPVRDRLRLYWSHCGTYRARHADHIRDWAGVDPVRSLDDIVALGEEVRRKGFKGLKTNLIRFDRDKPYMYGPGTGSPPGFPSSTSTARSSRPRSSSSKPFAAAPAPMSGCISTPISTTRPRATSGSPARSSRSI